MSWPAALSGVWHWVVAAVSGSCVRRPRGDATTSPATTRAQRIRATAVSG